ncbi:MAG: hypothetical protein QME66_03700 [Candidatus Eisenbacteria bacterium]|nr:hypothetical protein [Candidatus Eisenbacteria bacterium]
MSNMKNVTVLFLILIAFPPVSVYAAATDLPDISVIGDISAQTSNDLVSAGRNRVTIRGIELALQGYLYPEMRADVFLAMHRHGDTFEPEICEALVSSLRFFADGLGLKAGRIHIDFGKLNKIHQHERPFVDQPLALTNFFGPHGFVGEGVTLGYLFPLPFFLEVNTGTWWIPAGHVHEEGDTEPEESTEFSPAGRVHTGRMWAGFRLGDRVELEMGASGAKGNGSHYLEHQDDVMIGGADLTTRMWLSNYQRVIFQNEIVHLIRKVPVGRIERLGLWSFLGFQFNKHWDGGFRYDWSENAFPQRKTGSMVSTVGGYRFTETTRIRLQYGYAPSSGAHEATLQLVFGIGPHSHPLQ